MHCLCAFISHKINTFSKRKKFTIDEMLNYYMANICEFCSYMDYFIKLCGILYFCNKFRIAVYVV